MSTPDTAAPTRLIEPGAIAVALAFAVPLILWGAVAGALLSPSALMLPAIAPIAIWVAWSDMAHMKIPNNAVVALLGVFAILGLFAFPFADYAMRWSHFVVLLVVGFVLNMGRLVGAGDAKFAAAMGPFFAFADAPLVIRLFAALLLAAFACHRLARNIPAVTRAMPHWESWSRRDFPMGLALAGVILVYLVQQAVIGR